MDIRPEFHQNNILENRPVTQYQSPQTVYEAKSTSELINEPCYARITSCMG